MAKTLKLKIVTPERQALSEDVEQVILPGVAGSFGVLAGHAPTLAALKPGMLKVLRANATETYACSGGYAEVTGKEVVVLADALELASEINVERAKKAQTRAQERLAKKAEDLDMARAQASLERAKVRLALGENAPGATKN
jgi:F-type H+-transporting ATPase subunit epsilon